MIFYNIISNYIFETFSLFAVDVQFVMHWAVFCQICAILLSMASDSFTTLICLLATAAQLHSCPFPCPFISFSVRRINNVLILLVYVHDQQLNVLHVSLGCILIAMLERPCQWSFNGFYIQHLYYVNREWFDAVSVQPSLMLGGLYQEDVRGKKCCTWKLIKKTLCSGFSVLFVCLFVSLSFSLSLTL